MYDQPAHPVAAARLPADGRPMQAAVPRHGGAPMHANVHGHGGAPMQASAPRHGGAPMHANVPGHGGTSLPGPAPNTAGPHRHDILNKIDPTVDSQSGGTQIVGPGVMPVPQSQGYAPTGAHAHAQGGLGDNYAYDNRHDMAGADPRLNHDPTYSHGAMPAGHHSEFAAHDGPDSRPRQAPSAIYQPGPASRTAGPHRSNVLNELDPRVNHEYAQEVPRYRTR